MNQRDLDCLPSLTASLENGLCHQLSCAQGASAILEWHYDGNPFRFRLLAPLLRVSTIAFKFVEDLLETGPPSWLMFFEPHRLKQHRLTTANFLD